MSTARARPLCSAVAARIREWVVTADSSMGTKPMALGYLKAGDPAVLAEIALRAVLGATREQRMAVSRLALVIGTLAEPAVGLSGWSTEARVRVGLALLDCIMQATGWFTVGPAPDPGILRGWAHRGPKLLLAEERDGRADWIAQQIARELAGTGAGETLILRNLTPPFVAIRTLIGGRMLRLALTESAELDLPGGDIEPGRAVPMGRA